MTSPIFGLQVSGRFRGFLSTASYDKDHAAGRSLSTVWKPSQLCVNKSQLILILQLLDALRSPPTRHLQNS